MRVWKSLQQCMPLVQRLLSTGPGAIHQQQQHIAATSTTPVVLSRTWQVLGPWSIGTREAPWGADPLEYEGGFRNLKYDPDATYVGSLVPGANVPWTVFNADYTTYYANSTGSRASLRLSFGETNWQWHQQVYGWAGLQWQAWARGYIEVAGEFEEAVTLYTENVLEFYVDGELYFGGDFYAFRHAPTVLHLKPGRHQIDVRVIRDVRAMGGTGSPIAEVSVELRRVVDPLELSEAGVLMPDILHKRLNSRYGSVTVRNNGKDVLNVISIRSADEDIVISRYGLDRIRLAGGQTKPIVFLAELRHWSDPATLNLIIEYSFGRDPDFLFSSQVSCNLTQASFEAPFKYTFLHPSGIVSYAMLRPPSSTASCPAGEHTAPIFISLHGAGVEASWPMSIHSFDEISDMCAWLLIPTGTTRWSGDDWHTWGQEDIQAAVDALPAWASDNDWQGIGLDTKRWIVVGHSNGGQGAWHVLTHHPDKVIAAGVASGYSSIQNYVPYQMWSLDEPQKIAVTQAALNDYRHELLVRNADGIPLVIQHGGEDDNVPTYHGRLMKALLYEAGVKSVYSELPGAGHWFEGVMTTELLKKFYQNQLNKTADLPRKLSDTSLTVANPANTGTKAGVRVLHLLDPGRLGRIDFAFQATSGSCEFQTSNVYSFRLEPVYDTCKAVIVDGEKFAPGASIFEKHDQWWAYHRGEDVMTQGDRRHRTIRQSGGIDAVLRSTGAFKIISDGPASFPVALQISRNLLQYYSADSNIYDMSEGAHIWEGTGNVVSLLMGQKFGPPFTTGYPIRFSNVGDLEIRDASGTWRTYEATVGAIFVQPLPSERVELVVWGKDVSGLELAARLVPTLTGVGQPDFVLLSKACRWQGIGGVLAMGFFDHEWNVTRGSWLS